MTAAESHRCDCPACATRAALHLLQTDRPGPALAVLRDVPDAYEAALEAAYQKGRAAGLRAKPPRPSPPAGGKPKPAFRKLAVELIEAADRLGVRCVAELLGLRLADLPELMAGTVQAPRSGLERLRREAAEDVPF